MKKNMAFILIFAALLTPVFAVASSQDMYISQSFVLEGGYAIDGYSIEALTEQGHPFAGASLSTRIGGDITPTTTLYGLFNVKGSIDPMTVDIETDPLTGTTSYGDLWYTAGLGLGFGASWRVGKGWSFGVEGSADASFSSNAVRFGGSVSFVPRYLMHAAREWFGWSLFLPLTFSFDTTGFNAKLGIGVSLELSDYLRGY